MEAKKLSSIVKLRRMDVETAQEVVAACLAAETQSSALCCSLENTIWRETEAAVAFRGTHLDAQGFANWLPIAKRKLAAACTQHERAVIETYGGRNRLAKARSALRNAEELWMAAKNAERAESHQRSQAELDEIVTSRLRCPETE